MVQACCFSEFVFAKINSKCPRLGERGGGQVALSWDGSTEAIPLRTYRTGDRRFMAHKEKQVASKVVVVPIFSPWAT